MLILDFFIPCNLELLRKTSEQVLIDMVQLLFARLPQFKDDTTSMKQMKDLTTTKQQINRKMISLAR